MASRGEPRRRPDRQRRVTTAEDNRNGRIRVKMKAMTERTVAT
jgi:hypothetical protein